MAFALTFAIYFIAVIIALASGIDLTMLNDEGFPALGDIVGGRWLALIIAGGGMASALGLFSAVLLSISRIPKVMADDGLLPEKLHALHRKYKTPYISIIISAIIVSGMILWTFGDLLIIDITLYGGALFLEFISLIKFRIIVPRERRPFKIPLNVAGLCVLFLLPIGVYTIALSSAFSLSGKMLTPALFAIASLLSAEVIWRIISWRKKISNSRSQTHH